MDANRVLSGKTYSSDRSTPFSYNTSIIDLNFNRLREIKSANLESGTAEIAEDSGRIEKAAKIETVFSRGNYRKNEALVKRKFLINKNFRFYEPVKDAETMVEFQLLR